MALESSGNVQSVQLALDVLEIVAFSEEELGVTQIGARLNLSKGSVHRHLQTLTERGYLIQNPATSRYTIGPKSRLLSRLAPDTDLTRVAEGPMRELRDKVGHTVVLSERTPRGALVATKLSGTSAIEIGVRSGSELPFHASAQGKVFLAFSPRPFQSRVLSKPLQSYTSRTLISTATLEKQLALILKDGFASAPEETMLGINALAAPIFDSRDECIAALAIVGSIQFLPEKPRKSDLAALISAANQVSQKLGHGRPSFSEPDRRKHYR